MKTIYSMILSMCLLSCLTQPGAKKFNIGHKNNDTVINVNSATKQHPLIKEIGQLNNDTCSIHWYGGGLFSLCFEKNRVNFFFTPQCVYWYKT